MIFHKADELYYQGKPLMELSTDELRIAVVESYNIYLQTKETLDKVFKLMEAKRK